MKKRRYPFDVKIRRLMDMNGTLYLSLPREFVLRYGLRKGDALPVITNGEFRAIIPTRHPNLVPVKEKNGNDR